MGTCMGHVRHGDLYGTCKAWGLVWDMCGMGTCMGHVRHGDLYGTCVVWGLVWDM